MSTLKHPFLFIFFFALGLASQAQKLNNNIEFVENKGQWDSRVKFRGDVSNGSFFISDNGFTVLQHNPQDMQALKESLHYGTIKAAGNKINAEPTLRSHAYKVSFDGASPNSQIMPDKAIETYYNYFIGNDRSKWAGNCKVYQGITVKDVYPNVDVRYYTDFGMLKYDIIVKPGADLSKIALKYEGVDGLTVKDKQLVAKTSVGDLKESAPYTYQYVANERRKINCKYIVKNNMVTFDVRDYDKTSVLVIDPSLIFCSFSGSRADNWGFTATYGPDGSMYGGGIVFGDGFPTNTGASQTNFGGGARDIGIIKLSPNGGTQIYATYIGGVGEEFPHSLVVDKDGNLILAGKSNSPDYPVTNEGNGPSLSGAGLDIIVTKLNAGGSAIIGSKKIGGLGDDGLNISLNETKNSLKQNYGDDSRSEVNLDGAGNIYVASCTQSTNFPCTPTAFQKTLKGAQDGVVLKFDPSLNNLLFSSYLGGDGDDAAYVLTIGPSGNIYVGGGTASTNFPGNFAGVVGPAYSGNIDGFVTELSSDGSTIVHTTYLGTPGIDQVYGVQFDKDGFLYAMGQTTGTWPHINATYFNNNGRQFISKLQPDLSSFVYSTVFGTGAANPNISPTAFLVDRCENVYVSGWGGFFGNDNNFSSAGTTGLPVTGDAYKGSTDGRDFYFFVLKRDAVSQLYGSFFGETNSAQQGGTDHVDGGTSRFDQNGTIYQAICGNCDVGGGHRPASELTTPASAHPLNLAQTGAECNLTLLKMAFNLAGVGALVQSAIDGVPNDTAGCLPLHVVFNDRVRNAKQYIWDFGDGTPQVGPLNATAPDNGYTQAHDYTAVGTYQVMLIAIDPASCNIMDTSYIHIRVGDLKANLLATFAKTGVCEELSYVFHNGSTTDISRPFTDTSFAWDFGDNSPQVISGLADVNHTYPAPGPYVIKLILRDTSYCNNPDTFPLPINVAANVDAAFNTPATGCAPYTAEFRITGSGLTFAWDFGDPTSGADNTSSSSNPTHLYNSPGTYKVYLTASDPNTCNKTDIDSATITVYEKPTSLFDPNPDVPEVNKPIFFTNLSSVNSTSFKWVFGDGDSLLTNSRATVQHQYNKTFTFNACLIAFNAAGCSDTTCQPVSAIINPLLDVPNAFTPNSGDVNSVVMVRGFGIAKMHFIIWNRWGQKVFESSDRLQGWDGRVKGVVQPMDVYAYTLDAEFFDGTKTTRKGDITLIR